jgi:Ca-activated chloride channel homolog
MKTTGSKSQPPQSSLPYGLVSLADDGSRVPLPLRAIDVRFEVIGDCAQVRLQQEFEHVGRSPVDVVYAFPLPSDAAVHECVMTIGDRRVVAQIKPAAEAKATYDQARRDGKRAALVEGLRDNLFELNLGNVQPGDGIRIDFSYALPLPGKDASREIRIPVCPGVRYVPGKAVGADGGTDLVPDAGRLARARIDAGHPDAAVFYCAGTLSGAGNLESPSHDVELVESGDTVAVMLSGDIECPDRDFVLTWTAAAVTTALVSPGDPEHVLCSLSACGIENLKPEGREILFLLDSSGSMNGANWFGLLEAMELALGQLRASDRFSIRLFDNVLHDLSNGWKSPTRRNVDHCLAQLRRHGPSGGTNFTDAFRAVVAEASDLRRPVIVVITDGQFGDEERATLAARDCGVEVHTFGIDANVNEGVLRKIARRTHGTCSLASPGQDLSDKVQHLMDWLLAPTIHRILPVGEWELVGCPPSLRKGQSALVAFRHCGEGEGPASLEVDLELADGSTIRKSFKVRLMQGSAASVLASKFAVEALIDEGFDDEAVELACRRNILAPGVSFVAVDEFEKVVVATGRIEQANLGPATLQAFAVRDAGRTYSPAPDTGPSLGFITMPAPVRRSDNMLHCLPMSLPSGKAFAAEPAPPEHRTNYLPGEKQLLVLVRSIRCFEPVSWSELAKDVLFPWASSSKGRSKLLLDLMRDLVGLGDSPDGRVMGLALLGGLLPYLEESAREKLLAFIGMQQTSH